MYKSFKWILWEISPVLKEILNDKENQEKDFKEIIVSNANHIEAILFYAHMKIVDTEIMNLVYFYGASKQYQVKILEDKVIKMFESVENLKKADWVKLFWLSYVKYPEDQQMRAIFEKVKGHNGGGDTFAEANIDFILEFEEEFFDIFFKVMLSYLSRIKCFRITEAYVVKNLFDGNKNKKLEEIDLIEKNFVERFMNKMKCSEFSWDDYQKGPLVSNLLTTKHKIEHLEIIKKEYGMQTQNQIESYIKKLREGK